MVAALAQDSDPSPHLMQCMEVWGGNQAADNGVVMPGLDAWVYSRPFRNDRGGGDVHYVSSCGTGRIARMLVADVSGHGSKVADVAASLRHLMRRYVNFIDQSRFIESINREFAGIARAGGFATCVATTFFAPTNHLTVSNAGHPRPLWYRAKQKRWELLTSPPSGGESRRLANLPLGVDEPTTYDQFAVKLHRGDVVLIYTDSLIESRSPDGRQLGERGLLEVASTLDAARPESLIQRLLTRVEDYRGGAEAEDDVTILMLRHNGQATQLPLSQRFMAQFRFLGIVARRLLGGAEPIPWPELRLANILGTIIPAANRTWRGQ
jgi:sigma-B regulation protein RsbU (phosphoserine phosphatase)